MVFWDVQTIETNTTVKHVRNMLAKTVYIMHNLCCSIHRTYKMICAYLCIAERQKHTHIYIYIHIYTHSGSALGALKSLKKSVEQVQLFILKRIAVMVMAWKPLLPSGDPGSQNRRPKWHSKTMNRSWWVANRPWSHRQTCGSQGQ